MQIIFGQNAGVGVRVITADDYNGLDAQFVADFNTLVELLNFLKFCTARTDDVETASVAVLVDDVGSELNIFVVQLPARNGGDSGETATAR